MRALVFGATGQIGHFLLPVLRDASVHVEAVTRHARVSSEHITWTRLDLYTGGDAQTAPDLVFGCGPLDGLLAWLRRTRHRPGRVVAFSSTSAVTKLHSPEPTERALAVHLQECEDALAAHCRARGIGWTVLRPTLVYGCGMDANLSRIAALAQRFGVVPLPRGAIGLRQPVHAQDLAVCAWRAAGASQSVEQCYDLPGGEALSYREMVRRTVACLPSPGRVLVLPDGAFRLLAWMARRTGVVAGVGPGMLARLRQDLVFDASRAVADLSWKARPFHPEASHFALGESP